MTKRTLTTITLACLLATIFTLVNLPTHACAADDEQTSTEQHQHLTPEQRREKMLQNLIKLTPEEREKRRERYKDMTEKEWRQKEEKDDKSTEEEGEK